MITMDQESQERFDQALQESSSRLVYMSKKSEIVSFYQDKYGRGWKQHIVQDLAKLTGIKPKSLERRFDPSRLNNTERRNQDQYKNLGKMLPPIGRFPKNLAGKRAHVRMDVYAQISNSYTRKRFETTLTANRTRQLLEEGGVDAIFDQYGIASDNIDYLEDMDVSIDFI